MKVKWLSLFIIILIIFCVGCKPVTSAGTEAIAPQDPVGAATAEPAAAEQAADDGLPALAAEPQVITFTASDGQTLTGTYYPASVNPAPVIVLMHWMGGNEHDWDAVAVWLQNRGVESLTTDTAYTWLDGSWFPNVPDGFSVGVLTFTFRGCENSHGCMNMDEAGWLLDAQAAVLTAAGLEGADPTRIISAGASIGADGAADGCYLANEVTPGTCKGSFSLSPGGYLTVAYANAVQKLQSAEAADSIPAWCLADQSEIYVCEMAKGDTYRSIEIQDGGHGMMMINPNLDPQALELLIEFTQLTVLP
jgi:dienelactone hydrolase